MPSVPWELKAPMQLCWGAVNISPVFKDRIAASSETPRKSQGEKQLQSLWSPVRIQSPTENGYISVETKKYHHISLFPDKTPTRKGHSKDAATQL